MAPFVHGTWNSTVPKLVFSRCSGKPSTATRHPGPKTGTVFSVRENPSKSPKRPALPGAVNWEGAVLRHRPFVLLFFHTLSAALIRAFFHSPNTGPTRAFWELGRVLSPPWVETRNNGPHGAQQAGTGDPSGSWLRGAKKAAAGFCLAAAFRSLFHVLEVSPTAPPKAEADPLRL